MVHHRSDVGDRSLDHQGLLEDAIGRQKHSHDPILLANAQVPDGHSGCRLSEAKDDPFGTGGATGGEAGDAHAVKDKSRNIQVHEDSIAAECGENISEKNGINLYHIFHDLSM